MHIRHYVAWASHMPAERRAEGAAALARAFLYSDLDPVEAGEAERALTAVLDDPSPVVRRALAEALAGAGQAPDHLLISLAGDQPDIAAIVLERSVRFSDADLVDSVALGEDRIQAAVARRPSLSAAVAGAIAEVGGREAILALCANAAATMSDFTAQRILARFGADAEVRSEVAARRDIGLAARHALVAATAAALGRMVTDAGWLGEARAEAVLRDSRDRAAAILAAEAADLSEDGARGFAAHLRAAEQLTPALLLRALLSGNVAFVGAALSDLSGFPPQRVAGLLRNAGGLGFAALFRRAGLPDALLPVVRAALDAAMEESDGFEHRADDLDLRLVRRAVAACSALPRPEVASLLALLRRFEAEAARGAARQEAVRQEAARQEAVRQAGPPVAHSLPDAPARLAA